MDGTGHILTVSQVQWTRYNELQTTIHTGGPRPRQPTTATAVAADLTERPAAGDLPLPPPRAGRSPLEEPTAAPVK